MTDSPEAALRPTEATALLHAFVHRVVNQIEVRALFIKGPVLTAQGLRAPHESVDVDVLVDPSRVEELLGSLADAGWMPPPLVVTAPILDRHSVTLTHPQWGCELDIHDRFPGFLAPHQDVFDHLWERRETALVAHVAVACPDRLAHACIAALHWLRDGPTPEGETRLAYLASEVQQHADDAALESVRNLADRTGATEPLRPFLEMVGIEAGADSRFDVTAWRLRTEAPRTKGLAWVLDLYQPPLKELPSRAWRAFAVTEGEIRQGRPTAGPGALGLLRARVHRLFTSIRHLPEAVRVVRRERRRP